MSSTLKFIIGSAVISLIYFSLDIKPLDEYRAIPVADQFDAKNYALEFWEKERPKNIDAAPKAELWYDSLKSNPAKAIENLGHTLGISKTHYFMFKGAGVIESVKEEFVVVRIDNGRRLKIATEFIFGNAVRDGSGGVNIDNFINMTDFNNVSVEINKLVKEHVAKPLKESAAPGKHIEFAGATEINEENIQLDSVRIIPVYIHFSDGTEE